MTTTTAFPTTTPELPLVHVNRTWIEDCWKCSGTGSVSWGASFTGAVQVGNRTVYVPKVCFECNGLGYTTDTLRLATNRAKARASREAKAAAKWAAGQAERDAAAAAETARRDAWAADNAAALAELALVTSAWGDSVRASLAEYGDLNAKVVELLLASAARRAVATPALSGRYVITGEVASVKPVEGDYGTTWKLVVRDDRGFSVWGTCPSSLDASVGDRVTFTATVEVSDRDETFGFYKRPTKAALLSD